MPSSSPVRSPLITVAIALLALPAYAQTGAFAGTVARDSIGNPVGNAGAKIDGDIVLTALPVNLDAARTVAVAPGKRLPSGIAEMEDRRKMHIGGFFVTDSMLRANDERKLTYLLAQAPRLNEVLSEQGSGIYMAVPGRAPGVPDDPAAKYMSNKKSDGTFSTNHCYVNVYLNGGRMWMGPPSPFNPPPDFDAMWAREYSGIEFYASIATTPSQYNGTNAWPCGVLLLWTRR